MDTPNLQLLKQSIVSNGQKTKNWWVKSVHHLQWITSICCEVGMSPDLFNRVTCN